MKKLTLTELVAIVFAGLADVASAVQAYVSWKTWGEVSRAIVVGQCIDARSKVMVVIGPLLDLSAALVIVPAFNCLSMVTEVNGLMSCIWMHAYDRVGNRRHF